MSLFLNFRAQGIGGGVVDPYVLRGDGTAVPLALQAVDWTELGSLVAGRDVLFGVHGFNISYREGARSLGQLDSYLSLGGAEVFIGVLWPGDSWIPVIDYPFEGAVSIECGARLAALCARWLAPARSFSFVSHSLGARLVLEAVRLLGRRARVVCLTAGAINNDCLAAEYSGAARNADAISLLASHCDDVLKIAFPLGDLIAELLHDDHTPFRPALGYGGPRPPAPLPVRAPWQIPDAQRYGHLDYLPPHDPLQNPATLNQAKWRQVAEFARRAFRGEPQTWPP